MLKRVLAAAIIVLACCSAPHAPSHDAAASSVGPKINGRSVIGTKVIGSPGASTSGGGGGAVTLTGAVTGSGSGTIATTYATFADQQIMCNVSGGVASPGACSAAQVRTMLSVLPSSSFFQVSNNLSEGTAATMRTNLGLGTLATQSGTFSGNSSGTNTGDQTITLTGPVTGSGTGSFATTIASSAVTVAMMANLANQSVLGNGSGGSAAPVALALTNANQIIATSTALVSTFVSGVAGGQTLTCGTASGNSCTYVSTSNATKGTHIFDGQLVMSATSSGTVPSIRLAGGTNYGIFADSANVGLDAGGQLAYISNTGKFNAPGIWNVSGTALTGISVNGAQITLDSHPTVASGTSVVFDGVKFGNPGGTGTTVPVTGTTAITTAAGFNYIDIEPPTYSNASAVNITNAPTVTIKNAPQVSGSVTITNPMAFWVQAGTSRFDGAMDMRGAVIANNTIATALSSVGPTGSHTTVQEWFQIAGTSGTVRYVPGF